MALTDPEITALARKLGHSIFVQADQTAHTDLIGLKAAVAAIDTAMNATTTQIATARPNEIFKNALLEEIQAAAPNFTTQQAAVALVIWTADAAGLSLI